MWDCGAPYHEAITKQCHERKHYRMHIADWVIDRLIEKVRGTIGPCSRQVIMRN